MLLETRRIKHVLVLRSTSPPTTAPSVPSSSVRCRRHARWPRRQCDRRRSRLARDRVRSSSETTPKRKPSRAPRVAAAVLPSAGPPSPWRHCHRKGGRLCRLSSAELKVRIHSAPAESQAKLSTTSAEPYGRAVSSARARKSQSDIDAPRDGGDW